MNCHLDAYKYIFIHRIVYYWKSLQEIVNSLNRFKIKIDKYMNEDKAKVIIC